MSSLWKSVAETLRLLAITFWTFLANKRASHLSCSEGWYTGRNSRVTSLNGFAKMRRRECRSLCSCSLVHTQRSDLLYLIVTGWTGTPGLKPPALNLARCVPLVVVPSENIRSCGQASSDRALSTMSARALSLLSGLLLTQTDISTSTPTEGVFRQDATGSQVVA